MPDNEASSPAGSNEPPGRPPPPTKEEGAHGSKPLDPSKPQPQPIAGNPSVPATPQGTPAQP
jgi:hypothetical protein